MNTNDENSSDLIRQAESKERKRLTISYMNTPEAAITIDCFKQEAMKFSNDYIATLQHLIETSQPNLAEALLYGEVQELRADIEQLKTQIKSYGKQESGPKTFGRKD